VIVNHSAPKKTYGAVITARKKEFNKITSTCISSSQCEAKTGKASSAGPFNSTNPDLCEQAFILSINTKARWIIAAQPMRGQCVCGVEAHFDKTDEFVIGGDFAPKVNNMGGARFFF